MYISRFLNIISHILSDLHFIDQLECWGLLGPVGMGISELILEETHYNVTANWHIDNTNYQKHGTLLQEKN